MLSHSRGRPPFIPIVMCSSMSNCEKISLRKFESEQINTCESINVCKWLNYSITAAELRRFVLIFDPKNKRAVAEDAPRVLGRNLRPACVSGLSTKPSLPNGCARSP